MNLLTVKQVAAKLSCSESFVWKLVKTDPAFPKPMQIGLGVEHRARATRWVDSAINSWLTTKQQHEVHNDDEDRRVGSEVHSDPGEAVPSEG